MIKEWLDNNPVGVEDGLRHDKWCAMMWPRLKLLHELLADDGVIIVHIDDNELHHLCTLMTEVFGNENFDWDNTVDAGELAFERDGTQLVCKLILTNEYETELPPLIANLAETPPSS